MLCSGNPGCQRPDQLRGNELLPVVHIGGLESAPFQNGLPVDVFHNIRILVVVDAGGKNKAVMVVDQGGNIALDFGSVLANRQLHHVLNAAWASIIR